jgi:hypothetical protein
MNEILQYLKKHDQKLDIEVAEATGISLANVRFQLLELSTKGKIVTCHLTRYDYKKTIENISCRIAGCPPPAAPGRKPKTQFNRCTKVLKPIIGRLK